jgi:porin
VFLLVPLILCGGENGKNPSEALRIDDAAPFTGTLTGDWGGLRSDLAAKGVLIDLSYTEYYAGQFSGGVADDAFDFGGRADTFIHTDFGKLGLWEGGGFHTHLESRFGEAAERRFPRSGGIWPPNTGVVLPLGGSERLVASSLYFTQKLSDQTTLMLGKINAVDLLAGDPFFGGWARDRFTNIAFVAPPSGVVPPTIMGVVLNHRVDAWSFTFMGFDPDDRTNDYWPDDLFDRGVNLSLGATWTGKIAERTSSLGLTGTYSTREGALSDLLLPPDVRGGTEEGSYNVALSGSHLLYELDNAPGKGLGVYVKAATADGNPNPIQSSVTGGFAGHGVIPNRPDDVFGIGYYHYQWSDDLKAGVAPALTVADETGVEFFYNLAVTPWFRVSADLQWIDPANARFADAWIGMLRASVFF